MDATSEAAIDLAQAVTQGGVGELIAAQEVSILNKLVSAYRGGKMLPGDALTGIAVISELRLLRSRALRAVQAGADAVENLTTGA